MADYRYGTDFTLAGTTVIANNGTAALVAAPGAGTSLHLGGLIVSGEAAGGFKFLLQDTAGTEIFTFRGANMSSIPLSLPASGKRLAAARGLQLVNQSGVAGTVGAYGDYRLFS